MSLFILGRSVGCGGSSYRCGAYLGRYDCQRPRDAHLRENIVRLHERAADVCSDSWRLILTFVPTSLFLSFDRCEKSMVTIQSHVSKSALKEKEPPKAPQNKTKDIDKFHLYFDFTCNVLRIQPHQVAKSSSFCILFSIKYLFAK